MASEINYVKWNPNDYTFAISGCRKVVKAKHKQSARLCVGLPRSRRRLVDLFNVPLAVSSCGGES